MFEASSRVSTEVIENKTMKELARPERFELPTLWFEALEAGNLNAFVWVA
jgi:hypothetical protein